MEELREIAEPLLAWYDGHARKLPWRDNPEPYRVWVSEIMLQQTRVEAVKPYFERFLKELPTIRHLAEVPEERLMKLWEGLGYYNRVRNMQKAACRIVEEYQGEMPADFDRIRELPGIGSYTAGAIASFAFGIPKPAVDGNVLRVLSRVTKSYEDIMKQAVRRKMEERVEAVIPCDRAGDFNQSLIELGAIVCVPNGAPKCGECPLKMLCRAHAEGVEEELPRAKHVFSHIEWHMEGYAVKVEEPEGDPKSMFFVEKEEMERRYSIPAAFAAYTEYFRHRF